MLLILMYHQIVHPSRKQALTQITQHISYLADHFPIVLPGEPLTAKSINICLSFDDAYYDFYHYIFPLLAKKKVKAQLAIPTKYISESSSLSSEQRLAIPYPQGLEPNTIKTSMPLCTWEEICEMVQSKWVAPASHSHTHPDLTKKSSNLIQELIYSKALMEQKLSMAIDTFVYPFGKKSRYLHQQVKKHYQFAMRIGSAINYSWTNNQGLLYRIDADHLWPNNLPLEKNLLKKLKTKYLLNRLRLK